MPTEIVMPQMGESIVEGTITKWLKKPGDKIQRDEPLRLKFPPTKWTPRFPRPRQVCCRRSKSRKVRRIQVNTVVGTISDGDGAAPAKAAPAAEKKAAPASAPAAPKNAISTRCGEPNPASVSSKLLHP